MENTANNIIELTFRFNPKEMNITKFLQKCKEEYIKNVQCMNREKYKKENRKIKHDAEIELFNKHGMDNIYPVFSPFWQMNNIIAYIYNKNKVTDIPDEELEDVLETIRYLYKKSNESLIRLKQDIHRFLEEEPKPKQENNINENTTITEYIEKILPENTTAKGKTKKLIESKVLFTRFHVISQQVTKLLNDLCMAVLPTNKTVCNLNDIPTKRKRVNKIPRLRKTEIYDNYILEQYASDMYKAIKEAKKIRSQKAENL